MKENLIHWVPTACLAQEDALSLLQFHQNPRIFSQLKNSLHMSLLRERWIKEDIQADLITNERTKEVNRT